MSQQNIVTNNTIKFVRTYKAPKNLVFKAWSEPDRLEQWWGPSGFKTVIDEFNFHPQGHCLYSIEAPDGLKMCGRFIFNSIVPNSSIEFLNAFANEYGKAIRAPFNENWPLEMCNTLSLEEENGLTTLTLEISPFHATEAETKTFKENHEKMELGFKRTFERLEDYLLKN